MKETIWRILREVMNNKLALQFNWNGTKGKAAFKDLRLANVLFSKCFLILYLGLYLNSLGKRCYYVYVCIYFSGVDILFLLFPPSVVRCPDTWFPLI